jgi:glycosyltransferase involved in cell wall biosynthesis
MRITIATDAWRPQMNGVVVAFEQMIAAAASAFGAQFAIVSPSDFRTVPLPTYREIRLALATPSEVGRKIEESKPDYVHIPTEGPLGWAARLYCMKVGRPFTTSFHTRFPEYIAARAPIPMAWTYAILRRFHSAATAVMAPTESMRTELEQHGFSKVVIWPRGVDHQKFHPSNKATLNLPRPIFLYVGRVAVEKNIEAFLKLSLPGSTVVVGDGPARKRLESQYPHAHFLGLLSGEALTEAYASSDVFVFPSRTDTFGNVILEALACGLPVAAYPVTGPVDIIGDSGAGVLDEDLGAACLAALGVSKATARSRSLQFTWRESAEHFLAHAATC